MLSCGNVFGSTNLAENGGNTEITEFDMPEEDENPNVELLAEPEQQDQNEVPAIAVPFTLNQTPVIDPTILSNSTYKVVVINEADSVQTGYSTLQAAMQAIGTNSGSYTIVFVLNYTITTADKAAITANGANANLTITSKYINASSATVTITLSCSTPYNWVCNGDTTFKDIRFGTVLNIYGNCYKLIIGTGVTCLNATSSIYGGGSGAMAGNADVTILSGSWNLVNSGSSTGTMTGTAVINIGGAAAITSVSAATGVTSQVTLNIDGRDGATVSAVTANTAADVYNINLIGAKITGNLFLGNANLSITDTCTVGTSITASTTIETTITLSDGAILTNGSFNCLKANLVFGSDSKLICNGTTNTVANIVMEGDGAALNVKKGSPMTVSGTCTGENKLNVDFIGATPALLDIFLTFTTKTNANKDNYTYPRTNGYDGFVTVNGNVVYYDYVPPEGYVYDWYGTTSIYVGGHDATQNVDDLTCQFNLRTSMDNEAFRLWSGQLTAKINGYKDGKAFANYYKDDSPDFKYSIKVTTKVGTTEEKSTVYNLTGNSSGTMQIKPSDVFRGYKKSADGSNLDLAFYLGRDVGIVYLHITINPRSKVMSESWDYVNLSNGVQNIIMSHGGDITYAGDDYSYCISSLGRDIAFAFQAASEPVMFMWVDQSTTNNPAVAGKYTMISYDGNLGYLYENTIPQTVVSGTTIDTGMGIQWQYNVAAGATQSVSGGTAFGSPGNIQITGKDVTFLNPDKEDASKTVAHSAINVTNSNIVLSQNDWNIEGLPDGITVTGITDSLTVSAANTTNFNLTYSANLSVLPGTYPVHYTITNGTETYTFTDNITVIRDEVKITDEVRNEDDTENTAAISGIGVAAISPATGAIIYKYYDGKLSWTLDSGNYEIKKITVGETELTATELVWAKANNYLTFDEMTEDKDVVIYVGEPSEEPTNKVTVSKTVVGGSSGQSFAFTITVKDEDGAALADETELNCIGGIIPGSGATAPVMTTLTLDANGQAAFHLTDGQTLEIIGIPAEGKIQVVETAAIGYEAAHTVDGVASAAVDQKNTGSIDMENVDKNIAFYNTRVYDLTVSKTVEGEFGDKTKAFSFSISVKDANGNNITKEFACAGGVLTGTAYTDVNAPEIETLSISSGAGIITLKHGQFITVKNLDPAYKIQITEVDPGSTYTTKYIKGGTSTDGREVGEFSLGAENVTIGYTNTRVLEPITGIKEGSDRWIPVMGVALVCCIILGFVVYRRRKARQI